MGRQVFEGIHIAEFAAIAAGPLIGKHMADHGARSFMWNRMRGRMDSGRIIRLTRITNPG